MKRLLEIESKFHFHEGLVPRFRANQGSPPFARLAVLGTHVFDDTYYDRGGVLSKNGIWVRERVDHGERANSKTLEVKKRVAGDYQRSTFDELTDPTEISALIASQLPVHKIGIGLPPQEKFGLDVLARFVTTRQRYRADGRFAVVLDQTDFGHAVGEVELEAADAAQAHEAIDAFLARYAWFCQAGPVEGKLSAYFRLRGNPQAG